MTEAGPTRAGLAIGTLRYMSPEQARAEPVSGATDVFSLGVMLHEMATGRHPFAPAQGPGSDAALVGALRGLLHLLGRHVVEQHDLRARLDRLRELVEVGHLALDPQRVRRPRLRPSSLLEVTQEQGLKVRDVIRFIEREGWFQVRQRGSHRQFKHATKAGLVTIAGKPGQRPGCRYPRKVAGIAKLIASLTRIVRDVALAEEFAFWSWRQPDDVVHRAQFGRRSARDAEVVEPVALDHLLSIAPDAVVRA